jgi:kynurenine 3-monooxygenase
MSDITLIGGGCTGPLLGLLLARRGHKVSLFERRPDPRTQAVAAGRSINLALADRGIRALHTAGLMDALRPILVPMHSRMIHEPDRPSFSIPYGQRPEEVLWSVSRAALHRALIEAAVAEGVDCRFGQQLVDADFVTQEVTLLDRASGLSGRMPMSPAIAADGAGSAMRQAMIRDGLCKAADDELPHGYKELSIPAGRGGSPLLDPDHLHIWPRGAHMLIALPNADGSFTATLFMPQQGAGSSFAAITDPAVARAFFAKEFADALALIPDFERQYAEHPVGRLATVRTDAWHVDGKALLIGDAAHGIVPFHGQGLNACFEDCMTLDRLLQEGADWSEAFRRFTSERRPNCDAIARMALENYEEMRATVRDPLFLLQKELSLRLERRHPQHFIPRYAMVMFHGEIPYAVAEERGAIQAQIIREATAGVTTLEDVDLAHVDEMVRTRLSSLGVPAS